MTKPLSAEAVEAILEELNVMERTAAMYNDDDYYSGKQAAFEASAALIRKHMEKQT